MSSSLKDLKSRAVGDVGRIGVAMRRVAEASWTLRRRRYWLWATSCHGRQQQALGIDVTAVGGNAQRTWVMVFGATARWHGGGELDCNDVVASPLLQAAATAAAYSLLLHQQRCIMDVSH
nr:hypothetical protein Itr_chr01CG04700 [Ipomoea trifida]